MPGLRFFTFGVYDYQHNYVTDITFSVTTFTAFELATFKNEWQTRYGTNAHVAVPYDTLALTEFGQFIKQNFFTWNSRRPYFVPLPSDYNTIWEQAITDNFGGFYNSNDLVSVLPTSGGTADRPRKMFYLSQDGTTFYDFGIDVWISEADKYRGAQSINLDDGIFSFYQSGTGGNNQRDYFWQIHLPYVVVNDADQIQLFGICTMTGYGGPQGLLSNLTTNYANAFYESGVIPDGMLNMLRTAEGTDVDPTDTDPFGPGGNTGTGGGTGTFSGTGDAITIPSLPTLSATSAGFITLFNPSAAQMASLASYMWAGAFDLNTFRKIFADPMDCILGLSIVPVDVPAGSAAEVKVGNISTGIYMTTAASQYVEVDCGSLNVEEFWGAYLDYEPFTKAEIYLPYIGTHPIAVDDIMGKTVHVVYHVDILSGACVAYVKCGDSVLYSFIGQCSSSIPITGNDWTNVVNGVLSIAGSIGTMVATGGAAAPAAVGSIVSTAVNQMKPSVEKSGSLSGTGGMMCIQVPYLILTRPRQALPVKQNAYTGYPSFITSNLGTLTGYTEVEEIHLENVPATSGELTEIVSLLKGGVIL